MKKPSYAEKNPDGSISYHKNLTSSGSTIKRDYTKINDTDYSYSFIITDENGENSWYYKSTAHELGHIKSDLLGAIDIDSELINIYDKELAQFNSRYTNKSGI